MNKLHIYLDESGDLGKWPLGSKSFNIAIIATENPIELDRCIKRIRLRKLKKKLMDLPEIKANNSSPEIRRKVLKELIKTNTKFYALSVDKSRVYDYLFDKKDKLYNFLCGILIRELDIRQHRDLEIIVDRRYSSIFRDDFDRYVKNKFSEKRFNLRINVKHLCSHENGGLQATDFIAWSINRKFSFDDDSYLSIIEAKIKVMELWK